ncbi:MAG: hypothetical protein GY857_00055 [Desulfobacula sp.]|nr:hypothetical protein [Desulfobacula sp.]
MIKFKILLVPVLWRIISISLLYSKTLIAKGRSSQPFHFSVMPQGNNRYLLFSQIADEQVFEKINTRLKQYVNDTF